MSSRPPGGIVPSPIIINPSQEIFDYVMHNPENTNPNVLKSMLSELDSESSNDGFMNSLLVTINYVDDKIGDPGYSSNVPYEIIDAAYN